MRHNIIFKISVCLQGLPYDALPSFDFPRDEVEVDLYQIRKESVGATTASAGKTK